MNNPPDFRVGEHLVRPSLGEILLGSEAVHVEPRSMEVLVTLCEHAPEVVGKQELIEAVWGGVFVSDEVLTHAIWDLRRAFGDKASNPRFIQTIPKRGYRLIADVERVAHVPAVRRGRYPLWQKMLLALAGALALAVLATWALRDSLGDGEPDGVALILEPAVGSKPATEIANRLRRELAGIPGVVRTGACREEKDRRTYCLGTYVKPLEGDHYDIGIDLKEAGTLNDLYGTNLEAVSQRDLGTAVETISHAITIYLELSESRLMTDGDFRPWINLRIDDLPAVQEFLIGVEHTYRWESGSEERWTEAMEKDPDFVAPHVFITGTLRAKGDEERLESHRQKLEALSDSATAFQKVMLEWAIEHTKMPSPDDPGYQPNLARQISLMRVALRLEQGNRQLRSLLSSLHELQGSWDEAWELLEPLVKERWYYPDLYPQAARCAIQLGNVSEAHKALRAGLKLDPVDWATYQLLELIALYQGRTEEAAEFAARAAQRRLAMPDEFQSSDLAPYADRLAALAANDGRHEIAQRLREFSL